jgi:hypothetical protein
VAGRGRRTHDENRSDRYERSQTPAKHRSSRLIGPGPVA